MKLELVDRFRCRAERMAKCNALGERASFSANMFLPQRISACMLRPHSMRTSRAVSTLAWLQGAARSRSMRTRNRPIPQHLFSHMPAKKSSRRNAHVRIVDKRSSTSTGATHFGATLVAADSVPFASKIVDRMRMSTLVACTRTTSFGHVRGGKHTSRTSNRIGCNSCLEKYGGHLDFRFRAHHFRFPPTTSGPATGCTSNLQTMICTLPHFGSMAQRLDARPTTRLLVAKGQGSRCSSATLAEQPFSRCGSMTASTTTLDPTGACTMTAGTTSSSTSLAIA
mmetsp:Transcript_82399/g.183985  ORF Transcript_82399/g.183985 Transcript_82399/m.183985 type:complete len:282 (+) Transcript_82399:195-1040(+)